MGWIVGRMENWRLGLEIGDLVEFRLQIELGDLGSGLTICDVPDSERRHLREDVEVSIEVQHFEVIADGACGNHAIRARPDRQSDSARRAVEIDSMEEDVAAEGGLDDGEGQHGLSRLGERRLGVKSLKNFLQHRLAGHDLVEVDERIEVEPGRPSEHLDPDRGVNENHGDASCKPPCPHALL
jgi:hypothetical protein